MSRQNRISFWLGRHAPWLGGLVIRLEARAAQKGKLIDQMAKSMPEPDRAILRQPEIRAIFLADAREAFRHGARGGIHELRVYSPPWGFRLEDITMPVHLWQGTADKTMPLSMGRYQASAIPNCKATFYEGEGHLIIVTHIDEIAATMVG